VLGECAQLVWLDPSELSASCAGMVVAPIYGRTCPLCTPHQSQCGRRCHTSRACGRRVPHAGHEVPVSDKECSQMQGDQCERCMTRYASAHSELVAAGPEDACELDRTEKLEPMRTTNWRRTNDVHKFESYSSPSPLCASAAGRSSHGAACQCPGPHAPDQGRVWVLLRALPAHLPQEHRAYDLGPGGWKGGVLIMLPIRRPRGPGPGTWPH
jgi:hypothetical protein